MATLGKGFILSKVWAPTPSVSLETATVYSTSYLLSRAKFSVASNRTELGWLMQEENLSKGYRVKMPVGTKLRNYWPGRWPQPVTKRHEQDSTSSRTENCWMDRLSWEPSLNQAVLRTSLPLLSWKLYLAVSTITAQEASRGPASLQLCLQVWNQE